MPCRLIEPEVLLDPPLMRAILPALEADAALYRNYIYAEDLPLPLPVRAYGGADDPNVRREHLEGWAEQTTGFAPVQAPAWQVSLCVQALPSLQALPLVLAGLEQVPFVGLHVPVSWH